MRKGLRSVSGGTRGRSLRKSEPARPFELRRTLERRKFSYRPVSDSCAPGHVPDMRRCRRQLAGRRFRQGRRMASQQLAPQQRGDVVLSVAGGRGVTFGIVPVAMRRPRFDPVRSIGRRTNVPTQLEVVAARNTKNRPILEQLCAARAGKEGASTLGTRRRGSAGFD